MSQHTCGNALSSSHVPPSQVQALTGMTCAPTDGVLCGLLQPHTRDIVAPLLTSAHHRGVPSDNLIYLSVSAAAQVPTTLMAVVDASIGIKTGVNFVGKKNKLGTYCPPLAVFACTAFLRTLDARHLANGSAEVLKMACVKDGALFALLEAHAAALMATRYQVRHGAASPCSENVCRPALNRSV